MKRWFTLVLAVLLVFSALSMATAEEKTPLTLEELNQWTQGLIARAVEDGLKPEKEDDHYAVKGHGYTLTLKSEDLSPDSVLLGAVLDAESIDVDGLVGPRTLMVTQAYGAVLESFLNDNPDLQGTGEQAALYLSGSFPEEVVTGMLTRQGNEVSLIEYAVYSPWAEGVERAGVQFTIKNGMVSAIRAYFGDLLGLTEAGKEVDKLALVQEGSVQAARYQEEKTPLLREDLVLGGIDFVDVTMDEAVKALGEPQFQETLDDTEDSKLVIMQWENIHATFKTDKDGKFVSTENMVAVGDVQGPRSIRLNDSLALVLSLFENSAESLAMPEVSLYGSMEDASQPYGYLTHDQDAHMLYYSVPVGEGSVLVSLKFLNERLVEMAFIRN